MAKDPFQQFEIPQEMRAFAEQSVEQAKKAFGSFIQAATEAVSQMQGRAQMAQESAKDMAEKSMSYAEQNVASTFEFAQNLLRAKDPSEIMRLQSEFVSRQMQTLTQQAQDLSQSAAKLAADATKPKS